MICRSHAYLSNIVLFIVTVLVVYSKDDPKIHPIFLENLETIWADSDLKTKLKQGLSACQHSKDQSESAKDVSPCNKVFFLDAVIGRHEGFKNKKLDPDQVQTTQSTIDKKTLPSFQEFFVSNAIENKPIVISEVNIQSEELVEGLKECSEEDESKSLLQDESCQKMSHLLTIQKYMVNDYLQRLSSKKLIMSTPVVFRQLDKESSSVGLHTCPFSQHLAIEVLAGTVQVKMFDPTTVPLLDPTFMEPGLDGQFSADPVYGVDPFSNDELPSSDFEVSNHEFAFIPSGFPVAWKTLQEGTLLLKHCFVDASNYNRVKNELQLVGQVNLEARQLWKELSSPTLDLEMARLPEPLPYDQFVQWPRAGAEESTDSSPRGKNRRDKKNFKDWQDDKKWKWRVMQLTLPTLKSPTAQAFRRNATVSFASSYTKSDTDASILAYNVSWSVVSSKQETDAPDVQFIEVPEDKLVRKHTYAFGYGVPGYDYTAQVEGLEPDTTYVFQVAVIHNEVCGPFSQPSQAAQTLPILPPGPVFNITGEALGPASLKVCWQNPLDDGGEPVEEFHVMKEHAGEHTFEEWVFLGNFLPPSVDDRRCITVDYLLPASPYLFKIVALNSAGRGQWSLPSESFHTGVPETDQEPYHIYGRGWHDSVHRTVYQRSKTLPPKDLEEYHPHMMENFEVHGPVITLHDHSSTILVHGDGDKGAVEIDAWTCHWSGQSFSVTAEAVFAEPRDASSGLKNTQITHKRLVMVERGGIPIVKKVLRAQAAGALGVILIDNGKCKSFDQSCVIGADRSRNELFAQRDNPIPWGKVKIPVVLILQGDLSLIEKGIKVPEHDIMTKDEL